MNLVEILLIVAAIGYVMWGRLAGTPLQARRLVIMPVAMVILGAAQVTKVHVTLLDVALLAGEVVVALGLGLVRGLTIKVYEQGGHLWYRYSLLTLALWAVSIAVRLGLGVGAHLLGATLAPTATVLMMFGVTFLGEAAVVGGRALRSGVPFAPDRRASRLAAVRGLR